MLRQLNGGVARDIPGQWARWKHVPDIDTIVHILACGWLTPEGAGDFAPLPGGFFAQVNSVVTRSEGTLDVLTLPRSITDQQQYLKYDWGYDWGAEFTFHLRAPCWDITAARLEVVPDDVQDAVRAYLTLQIASGAEQLPLVVEDGWLC